MLKGIAASEGIGIGKVIVIGDQDVTYEQKTVANPEEEVKRLLSMLNEHERELIGMIYFQKMKNEEIGNVLGIAPKAVSERHRRLLAKCRKIVEKTHFDF